MKIFHKSRVQLTILLVLGVLSYGESKWRYELNDIYSENQTPDIVTVNLFKKRISRGIYSVSGEIDIKQDLTDDFHVEIDTYFSKTGSSSSFVRTPFRVATCTLSEYGRNHYRDMLMNSVANCTDNAWQLEMPLTKRLVKINDCDVSTDNMPSHVTPGYYRAVFRYTNQAQGSVTVEAVIGAADYYK